MSDLDKRWNKIAQKMLVGKTVKSVSYLTEKEAEEMGWSMRPVVIEFTDGTQIFPMRDDEGNDGGALATSDPKNQTLPVL